MRVLGTATAVALCCGSASAFGPAVRQSSTTAKAASGIAGTRGRSALRTTLSFAPLSHSSPCTRSSIIAGATLPTTDSTTLAIPQTNHLDTANVTLSFPSYYDLMNLQQGECVTSQPFQCGESRFQVKLYPRGGGHGNRNTKSLFGNKNDGKASTKESGFGMGYAVVPLFAKPDEKVGVYLQYLPQSVDDTIDATFALRLKGQQRSGARFDVEWRAGMRFVDLTQSDLCKGCANDFGAHLMQTNLLQEFVGSEDFEESKPITMEVEVTLHGSRQTAKASAMMDEAAQESFGDSSDDASNGGNPFDFLRESSPLKDIRLPRDAVSEKVATITLENTSTHNPTDVRVGKVVVPVIRSLRQRPRMFQIGAYPGVEYRILRILDSNGEEHFTSFPGADYELKPICPLVQQLERPWPATINEREIPKLLTQDMYNFVSVLGALFAAAFGLTSAFLLSQAISLFFIPSKSMDPTLEVGDVLLVEKVSARLFPGQSKPGDVVLFRPPSALRDIVAANGGRLGDRDLFVKRAVATSGDTVSVDGSGNVRVNEQPVPGKRDLCDAQAPQLLKKYIGDGKEPRQLQPKEVFVMGDCSSVSVDSRVWGPLQQSDLVGRPIMRIWPLEKFGPIQSLPPMTMATTTWED